MAEVAARSRQSAAANPFAQVKGSPDVDALLDEPYLVAPLRRHDCPPVSDGACAMVLAAGDRARKACARPAWIRGIDHRIEPHSLGARDLTRSPSTALAAERAGVRPSRTASTSPRSHAPFTHQEIILRDALGLGPGTAVNPSGGALAANPIMVAGLTRVGEAAQRVHRRERAARRGARHVAARASSRTSSACWRR